MLNIHKNHKSQTLGFLTGHDFSAELMMAIYNCHKEISIRSSLDTVMSR